MIGLRVHGIRETRVALRAALSGRASAVRRVVERFTVLVAREAQGLAPVDLGDLRASIRPVLSRIAAEIVGVVEATADHAPFVEFGTGDFVEVPPGQEDYAMQFYVNGEGKTRAQPFLFPALETHRAAFVSAVRRAVGTGQAPGVTV